MTTAFVLVVACVAIAVRVLWSSVSWQDDEV